MAGGTGKFQAGTLLPGFLRDILALGGVTTLAVASTGTIYSKSFFLHRGYIFGWEFNFTGSTVAVTVELEQANQPPVTEGAQDDAFVIPISKTGASCLAPLGTIVAAGTRYIGSYQPVATVLARLKITGTGSNGANTVMTIGRLYEVKEI